MANIQRSKKLNVVWFYFEIKRVLSREKPKVLKAEGKPF
jgi:hypothetical protein